MADKQHTIRWALFGAGGSVGGLLLASGCGGACTACFGCVGPGIALVAAALLRRPLPETKKGGADGMAARFD